MRQRKFATVVCNVAKPTRQHRLAMWEGILGTVNARNAAGITKYFDYNYKAAIKFAGIDKAADIRLAKVEQRYDSEGPKVGQKAVYIK